MENILCKKCGKDLMILVEALPEELPVIYYLQCLFYKCGNKIEVKDPPTKTTSRYLKSWEIKPDCNPSRTYLLENNQ